jgi:predicted nucleic acid-binding protein
VNDPIVLDAGPLALVTNPKPNPENLACAKWLQQRLDEGSRIIVPAIVCYEVRRELIRAGKTASLRRLDAFCDFHEYIELRDRDLRHAAELWADVRQRGKPTSIDSALDGDVILAAQAIGLDEPDIIVATTNVKHISLFVNAALWQDIR